MSELSDYNNIPWLILWNTGEVPTFPSSDYRSLDGWAYSDIMKGQLAINIVDKKMWFCSDTEIVELRSYTSTSTKYIDVSTSTYTIDESTLYNDIVLHVSTASTITLSTEQVSRASVITIKSAGDNITVDTEGSETIDGETSQTLFGYDSMVVYPRSSNWWIK